MDMRDANDLHPMQTVCVRCTLFASCWGADMGMFFRSKFFQVSRFPKSGTGPDRAWALASGPALGWALHKEPSWWLALMFGWLAPFMLRSMSKVYFVFNWYAPGFECHFLSLIFLSKLWFSQQVLFSCFSWLVRKHVDLWSLFSYPVVSAYVILLLKSKQFLMLIQVRHCER